MWTHRLTCTTACFCQLYESNDPVVVKLQEMIGKTEVSDKNRELPQKSPMTKQQTCCNSWFNQSRSFYIGEVHGPRARPSRQNGAAILAWLRLLGHINAVFLSWGKSLPIFIKTYMQSLLRSLQHLETVFYQ